MSFNLFQQVSEIRITCAAEITAWLEQEITLLGYTPKEKSLFHVAVSGTLLNAAHLCTHLRTAYKVLYFLADFPASHPDILYTKLFEINWHEIIPSNGYVCVESFTQNNFIRDSRYTNLKAKDAIVDKILKETGVRPNSGPSRLQTVIYIHWVENAVKVFIDASGESLTRQGYRKIPHKAPLQESLAAAILMATGWDKNSAFINPMCGSGTLAIQAALMAMESYPGHIRKNFGFMHVLGYGQADKSKIWPQNKPNKNLAFPIVLSDNDREALQAAKINAEAAGVLDALTLYHCDFRDTAIPTGSGVVILNPEYGERLGEITDLVHIYGQIGDFFKQKCIGYTGFVFTGNRELAGKIGLKPGRKTVFYNGRIECRLLKFELYSGRK